jgi:CheY-like chemotaxis protein
MNEKRTMLLVDDSQDDLSLLRIAFKKAEVNFPLQEVHNGEEAIAYLKGESPFDDRTKYPTPAVVLLDLNMPMKNGFDVLRWVGSQPRLKRISVIILTASVRLEDVEQALDLGANAFLVKPTNLEGLVRMIRCLGDWIQINHLPPYHEAVMR